MVSVRRGLLQGGVRDVRLLVGVHGRLEKVGHEEDLQETERKGEPENGARKKTFKSVRKRVLLGYMGTRCYSVPIMWSQ